MESRGWESALLMRELALIDSHCHLTDDAFNGDRAEMLERARRAGVCRFVVIGATGPFRHNESAVALANSHPDIFAVIGVHPHDAAAITPETYTELRRLALEPKVVGLGETGLDFYYDRSPRDLQRTHFRTFIRLAQELGLPLSMHVRDAYGEAGSIIQSEAGGRLAGVMHCFTGTVEDASVFLELGLSISFSGIITFRSAGALREVVKLVPLDRMAIETDCPYLAPVPYRGKRNEPAHVRRVAETIAELKAVSVDEVAAATRRNTERLFGLTGS